MQRNDGVGQHIRVLEIAQPLLACRHHQTGDNTGQRAASLDHGKPAGRQHGGVGVTQENALARHKPAAHQKVGDAVRIGQPQDVADAIVWLITGARQVTGEVVYVDGGMHIATPR